MGSELMFVYCRALPERGPGELPGHTQERNFCRGFIFDGGISFLSTKAFVTKNPRNFFNFHCLAAFQEALLWLKALNNEKEAQDLTGSDSKCSESDSECREAPLAWFSLLLLHHPFLAFQFLYSSVVNIPPFTTPAAFFSLFSALYQQKITAGVTSIKQQVDLKSRNGFKDGFVVSLWMYHIYNEGLEYFDICHRGNLIVIHPQRLWSWVISFHILSIVLACSPCMERGIENDLPLKS